MGHIGGPPQSPHRGKTTYRSYKTYRTYRTHRSYDKERKLKTTKMKTVRNIMIMVLLAVAAAGCTDKQKAESAVKNFLNENLAEKEFSIVSFGRLDSTRYINDDVIASLRKQASTDKAFNITTAYADRDNPKQLIYMPVKIKVYDRQESYTFYLTMDFKKVVCFK